MPYLASKENIVFYITVARLPQTQKFKQSPFVSLNYGTTLIRQLKPLPYCFWPLCPQNIQFLQPRTRLFRKIQKTKFQSSAPTLIWTLFWEKIGNPLFSLFFLKIQNLVALPMLSFLYCIKSKQDVERQSKPFTL